MATSIQEPPPTPGSSTPPPEQDPVAQAVALLRPWIEYVPPRQRRLGLFIFLVLLVHLAAFFFIRIDTTRAEMSRQPRTHVTVETPISGSVSKGTKGDRFWDRLTDPRLFILPPPPPADIASDVPALDFRAINASIGTKELPPAAEPAPYHFTEAVTPPLEERADDALTPARQPFTYQEKPPAIATRTVWKWDPVLAARQPANVIELPSAVSDTVLSPTQLRVAVDPSGAVDHVLVERSCGTFGASMARDLDQRAVAAARKLRFRPSDTATGPLWGRITIFWHYTAKPREEVVPTPPSGI